MASVSLRAVGDRTESDLFDRFASTRAVVVGEAMLDVYVKGSVTRLCPEGPFPVVDAVAQEASLGGAANVAANLVAMGAAVSLVSLIGEDRSGDEVVALARRCGLDVSGLVRAEDRFTLAKRRVVGDGRAIVRVDEGSTGPSTPEAQALIVSRLGELAADADLVIISDYRYGTIGDQVIAWLENHPQLTMVVDSKGLGRFRRLRPAAVTSNYGEVAALVGADILAGEDRVSHIDRLGPEIAAATGASVVAVTVDSEGVVVIDRTGRSAHLSSAGDASDPCGAGDTFTAVMSLGLVAGADPLQAAALAGRAAAVVVGKPGTAVCTLEELRADSTVKWCDSLDALVDIVARRRAAGQSVVLTNGCFDVLHAGHVASLEEAARMGDALIVALNSDAGVARLKGHGRPINPLADRAAVLAGLSVVDHIVAFDEDSPLRLLERIRPDVYCKGGDYAGRWIPEIELVRSWGGRFELTSYLPDRSTTATMERARGSGVGLGVVR